MRSKEAKGSGGAWNKHVSQRDTDRKDKWTRCAGGESTGVSIHDLTARDAGKKDALRGEKGKPKNDQRNSFHAGSGSACWVGLGIFPCLPGNRHLGWVIAPDISPRKCGKGRGTWCWTEEKMNYAQKMELSRHDYWREWFPSCSPQWQFPPPYYVYNVFNCILIGTQHIKACWLTAESPVVWKGHLAERTCRSPL